ncbi:MAG: hypothetical protein WBQ29_24250 [Isosphaeraceae bacterium]
MHAIDSLAKSAGLLSGQLDMHPEPFDLEDVFAHDSPTDNFVVSSARITPGVPS